MAPTSCRRFARYRMPRFDKLMQLGRIAFRGEAKEIFPASLSLLKAGMIASSTRSAVMMPRGSEAPIVL